MKTTLDLANWSRQAHFEMYKNAPQPYFNVCIGLESRALQAFCFQEQIPFSYAYLYLAQQTIGEYFPMGLRIENQQVVHYPQSVLGMLQLADDDTFRFSYLEPQRNFKQFQQQAKKVAQQAKADPLFNEQVTKYEQRNDLIHTSVLPWLHFTSFSHAIAEQGATGIPKLVFGKYDKASGKLPFSIDVHHALMDGLHVAQFVKLLQAKFNQPTTSLK